MYVHGFRFYFTPLNGVLFAFPSRYWFTIGQSVVFSLGGWSPHVQTEFHVFRPTRFHNKGAFRVRGYHPLWPHFPECSTNTKDCLRAGPRSLAATRGISVDFFSSGYLDVSVPRVRLLNPMYSGKGYRLMPVGFPIRKSLGQSLFINSPTLIADYHVLHRL